MSTTTRGGYAGISETLRKSRKRGGNPGTKRKSWNAEEISEMQRKSVSFSSLTLRNVFALQEFWIMVSQPHKHTVPINVPRTFRRSVSSVICPELLSWLRRSLSLSLGPVDPPIRVLTISCSHHLFTCFCRDFASHSTSCLNSRPRISPQHVTCQPCEKATRRSTYLKTGSPKHQETASSCYYWPWLSFANPQVGAAFSSKLLWKRRRTAVQISCRSLPTSANICRCLWILWILWAANSSRCDLSQISLPGDEREEQLDANSSDDTLNILPAARAFSMDL